MADYIGTDGRTHPPHTTRLIVEGEPRPDWRNHAACRDEDPELFFPIGNTGPALVQIEDAKAVCRRCPVIDDCRAWALAAGEKAGVWGGLSEDERDGERRRERRRRDKDRWRQRVADQKQAAA